MSLVLWFLIGVLFGYLIILNIEHDQRNTAVISQLEVFKSKGPRFTAVDGDNLCRSVQELQRQAGLPERECRFGVSE